MNIFRNPFQLYRPLFTTCLVLLSIAACSGNKEAEKPAHAIPADSTEASQPPRDSAMVWWVAADTLTVFEQLRARHTVDFQESAMGIFVKSIDSLANGNNTYWIYKVNDTMVPVGSSSFHTRVGDTVAWHFRHMSQK